MLLDHERRRPRFFKDQVDHERTAAVIGTAERRYAVVGRRRPVVADLPGADHLLRELQLARRDGGTGFTRGSEAIRARGTFHGRSSRAAGVAARARADYGTWVAQYRRLSTSARGSHQPRSIGQNRPGARHGSTGGRMAATDDGWDRRDRAAAIGNATSHEHG